MSEAETIDAATLYDTDFIAWAKQQAEALRAAAGAEPSLPLDWENLAAEVESLGASERRELHSQVRRIIRHLLKLEFSPAIEARRGWFETVGDARGALEVVLEFTPSLRDQLAAAVRAELPRGAREAIRDLEKYGEIDDAGVTRLRAARYTTEQVAGDWFPPDPRGTLKGK